MGGDWPRVFYGGFQVTKWRHDAKSQLSFKSFVVSVPSGPNTGMIFRIPCVHLSRWRLLLAVPPQIARGNLFGTYLSWKGVIVDRMLWTFFIVSSIVNVELFELIPIRQRTSSNVNVLLRVLVDTKHHWLASIVKRTADLELPNYFYLIEMDSYFVFVDVNVL